MAFMSYTQKRVLFGIAVAGTAIYAFEPTKQIIGGLFDTMVGPLSIASIMAILTAIYVYLGIYKRNI